MDASGSGVARMSEEGINHEGTKALSRRNTKRESASRKDAKTQRVLLILCVFVSLREVSGLAGEFLN